MANLKHLFIPDAMSGLVTKHNIYNMLFEDHENGNMIYLLISCASIICQKWWIIEQTYFDKSR